MKRLLYIIATIAVISCNSQQHPKYAATGSIERIDPALDSIIMNGAVPEIIAEGFEWSEGPLWVDSHQMLLFSDVPRDTVYKWTEKNGKEVYLTPSGYSGTVKRGGEMGSNGLLLDAKGNLVLCQHGNRQVARMNAPLDKPKPDYIIIAGQYEGKKFNSPNDAAYNNLGELFFTDPPYGLEKQMNDPLKEIPFQGVYRVSTTGQVSLVTDSITRPNGIGFLPDGYTMLVANSDPRRPYWYAIDTHSDDTIIHPRIFYSAAERDPSWKGLPDGLKVDKKGNVFATGPGGIWIFTKEARLLGRIRLKEPASNCALSADEKTLYITNDMYVLRLKMR